MIDQDDQPKQHPFSLEDGSTLTAQRKDPFGFYHVTIDKGKLPEKFSGMYTSVSEVERAVKEYKSDLEHKSKGKVRVGCP